jgi:hypothetical protein
MGEAGAVPSSLACLLLALAQGPGERREGIWISRAEIQVLPMSGRAWDELKRVADEPASVPRIGERNDDTDVCLMAKALVHVRTGEERYRDEVLAGVMAAMGSEDAGDCLSLARNLPGYVISAELVGLGPTRERLFRAWLAELFDKELDGKTLRGLHEDRPNNWGTHAGGSRAVLARYLERWDELERVARVFKGYLGDRASYDGFRFGELTWQADPAHPVGVNPRGAVKDGHSVDGVLPDDQRRAGEFCWPPPQENYCYEALQGALLQAIVLWRAGYDVWEWQDKALLRAFLWLEHQAGFPAQGDDTWQPHVINHFYRAGLRAPVPARPGKNVGWTDWTLSSAPRH